MSSSMIFSIKYGALATLVLQNTFQVVLMNISRTSKGSMYAASTAVVSMEFLKVITSMIVIMWEHKSIVQGFKSMYEQTVNNSKELLHVTIIALLYCIQNNLLYFALSHLDATTYQVGYQLKILTTALFSVQLLNKHITRTQWLSLALLTIGVCLAQYSSPSSKHSAQNSTLGFVAVISAAFTSGFAGVYYERVLKQGQTSLWMRNFHLSLCSIPLSLAMIYCSGELSGVLSNGFFYGYNYTVLLVITMQAFGGMIVAVVMKYADNILKGFAAAFSILTSSVVCYIWLDFQPTSLFVVGSLLVLVSGYMYSSPAVTNSRTDLL